MEGVVCVRHWTSASEVMSFLGVRKILVAVRERKLATRCLSCVGDIGRLEVMEGWEMLFQVWLLLLNRTQGSWIRTMSMVLCARWRSICITYVDFVVLC